MSVSGNKGRNMTQYQRNYGEKPLTLEDVSTFPMVAVPQMSIIKEDAEYYEIRSEYSKEDGLTLVATYLPCYNQEGKLTGYKRRDWTKDKEEKGHFTVIGSVRVSSQLFGQSKCKPHGKSSLIYVEGEGDVVATRRAMLDSLKGTSWEGKIHPNVVGLNCGAGNATETTAHNEEFIRKFAKLVLVMDADEATDGEKLKGIKKGVEATEDIASFLLTDNIYTFKLPDGIKDPREMLDAGLGVDLGKGVSFNIVRYTPEKILSLRDVSIKSLRKKKKKGIPFRHMPKLTEHTGGAITGELWCATGPSGAGKSTIVRDIEFDIVEYLRKGLPETMATPESKRDENGLLRIDGFMEGERCGIIRLEEDEDESINSLYAMDMKVDPKEFCGEPEAFLTEEEHERLHNLWSEEDKIKILDHFGSLPIISLISKLKQLVFMYNCRWIVLDHLSMLVSGLRGGDDRKELDIIMTELASFCKQFDVFIIAVSHMKRKNFEPPKDKDTQEPLPFFYPVRKEDLRGSAALEQLSWVVLLFEPEELPNRSRGRVRVVTGKNRRGKKLGIADTLWMKENGTFVDAADWVVEGESFMLDGVVMHYFGEEGVDIPQEVVHNTPSLPPIENVGADEIIPEPF